MSDWNFRNLDLSGVDIQRPSRFLPVGNHVCVLNDCEVVTSKSGWQIILYWEEIEGAGSCRDYITIHANSKEDNAQLAERIGKERLKAVLTYGGHPTPDNPNDVNTMKGMVVGVICEKDDDWIDKFGNQRQGIVKPRRNGAYVKASDFGYTGALRASTTTRGFGPAGRKAAAVAHAAATPDLDDQIPF